MVVDGRNKITSSKFIFCFLLCIFSVIYSRAEMLCYL